MSLSCLPSSSSSRCVPEARGEEGRKREWKLDGQKSVEVSPIISSASKRGSPRFEQGCRSRAAGRQPILPVSPLFVPGSVSFQPIRLVRNAARNAHTRAFGATTSE